MKKIKAFLISRIRKIILYLHRKSETWVIPTDLLEQIEFSKDVNYLKNQVKSQIEEILNLYPDDPFVHRIHSILLIRIRVYTEEE